MKHKTRTIGSSRPILAGLWRSLRSRRFRLALAAQSTGAAGPAQTATNPIRYQVNYRASANDPWQLYAATRSLDKANTIAAEVKSTGYQSAGREQPDAGSAAVSGRGRNQRVAILPDVELVVRLQLLRRSRPELQLRLVRRLESVVRLSLLSQLLVERRTVVVWSRLGRALLGWRLAARRGWGGAGWSGGAWSGNHRNWNNSHVDRSTHDAHHERHSEHAHHQYHAHHNTAGHHQPGPSRGGAGMRTTRRPSIAERGHRGAARARPAIGRPATTRPGTRHAGTVPEAAAGRHNSPGPPRGRPSRRASRSLRMNLRDSKLRPGLLQQARRWTTSDFRLGSARIALVALLRSGAGERRLAQDPQSQTLEQWLGQLKDPDAAKRRQAVVSLGSFGPDLTKAMITQVGELLEGSRPGRPPCGGAFDRQFRPGVEGGACRISAPP